MERVAFLIEATQQRISCLINPGEVVLRRTAGVYPRRSAAGSLVSGLSAEDPVLYTGGGRTELEFGLLFDVALATSGHAIEDVRELTRPFLALAGTEIKATSTGVIATPLVRFLWGRTWNILAAVVAAAERLERFTADGVPQRSWMRLRLWRMPEPTPAARVETAPTSGLLSTSLSALSGTQAASTDSDIGSAFEQVTASDRLETIAQRHFGHPAYWRWLAAINNLDDPLSLPAGMILRVPAFPPIGNNPREPR